MNWGLQSTFFRLTLSVNNNLNILDGSLTLWGESILNVGNDLLIELNAGLNVEIPTC